MSRRALGVVRYRDPAAFLTAAGEFLLSAESENNLILGIALELAKLALPETEWEALRRLAERRCMQLEVRASDLGAPGSRRR